MFCSTKTFESINFSTNDFGISVAIAEIEQLINKVPLDEVGKIYFTSNFIVKPLQCQSLPIVKHLPLQTLTVAPTQQARSRHFVEVRSEFSASYKMATLTPKSSIN